MNKAIEIEMKGIEGVDLRSPNPGMIPNNRMIQLLTTPSDLI
jgi:hypothetical protein